MLTPHGFVVDKQVELTIIAPCKQTIDNATSWAESLLCQGHRQPTEVILLLPQGEITAYWQQLLANYQRELERSPYIFSYLAIGNHNDGKDLAITINQAIKAAQGTWIYILPTDYQLGRATCFELTAVIKECPEVALISGLCHRWNTESQMLIKSHPLASEGFVPNTFKSHLLQRNPLTFGSTALRKEIWERYDGLNPEFAEAAWWEFLRRIVHDHWHWYYVARPFCYVPSSETAGELLNAQGGLSQAYLRLIQTQSLGYTSQELTTAQTAIAQQLFRRMNYCFKSQAYAKAYGLIFDLLEGIDVGNQLWLETLHTMKRKQLPYKQEILKVIQLVQQRLPT